MDKRGTIIRQNFSEIIKLKKKKKNMKLFGFKLRCQLKKQASKQDLKPSLIHNRIFQPEIRKIWEKQAQFIKIPCFF